MPRRVRRAALLSVPALIAGAALLWLPDAPSADVVHATGIVVSPEVHPVYSPIEARIRDVHVRPGDVLDPGDPIVSLDLGAAEEQGRRIEQDLAINNSAQLRAQIALQDAVGGVDAQIDQKSVELRALNGALARQRRLLAEGQATDEAVQVAVLAVQQAEFELARLQEERWRLKADEAAAVDAASAHREHLVRAAIGNRELLDRGTIRASVAGRVLSIAVRGGEVVARGQTVAVVSDAAPVQIRVALPESWSGGLFRDAAIVLDGTRLQARVTASSGARAAAAPDEILLAVDALPDPRLTPDREVRVILSR